MARGRKADIRAPDGALSKTPAAPKWLPELAKIEWKRVVPQLVMSRKIAAHELQVVESYCLAVALMRQAESVIQKEGMTFESEHGPKRRPETTILKENIEASRRLAAELGLTPASRNKNEGGAVHDDDEDSLGFV